MAWRLYSLGIQLFIHNLRLVFLICVFCLRDRDSSTDRHTNTQRLRHKRYIRDCPTFLLNKMTACSEICMKWVWVEVNIFSSSAVFWYLHKENYPRNSSNFQEDYNRIVRLSLQLEKYHWWENESSSSLADLNLFNVLRYL